VDFLTDVSLHMIVGVMFALTGIYASRYCEHRRHQIIVGSLLILLESTLIVWLIG